MSLDVNPAQAYIEGILWAVYGVKYTEGGGETGVA